MNFGIVKLAENITASTTLIRYQTLENGVPLTGFVGRRVSIFRPYAYPLGNDPNIEICLITAATANTITVTRGQEGTTASAKTVSAVDEETYFIIPTLTQAEIDSFENIPTGGGEDHLLKKDSTANYDASWSSLYTIAKNYLDANSFNFNDGTETISIPEETQASIYEWVKLILQEGSNVTLTESDAQHTVTIASSGGGSAVDTDTTYTLTYDNVNKRLTFSASTGGTNTIDISEFQTAAQVSQAITTALNNANLGVSPTQANIYPILRQILQAGAQVTIVPDATSETLTLISTSSGGGGGGETYTFTYNESSGILTIVPSSGTAQTINLNNTFLTTSEVLTQIEQAVTNIQRLPVKATLGASDYSVIAERFGGDTSKGAVTLARDDAVTITSQLFYGSHDVTATASTSLTNFNTIASISTLGAKETADNGTTIPFVIGIRPLGSPNGGLDIYTLTSKINSWGNRLNVEIKSGSYDMSFDMSTSGNWLPHSDVTINGEAVSVLSVRDTGAAVPSNAEFEITIEPHSSQSNPTFVWNPEDRIYVAARTEDTNTNVMNVTTILYRKSTTVPTNLTNAAISSMDINSMYQIQNLPTDTSRNGYDLATGEKLYQCEVRIVKDLVANNVLHREATQWQEIDEEGNVVIAESRANNSQIYAEFFRAATQSEIETTVNSNIFSKRLVNAAGNQVQESAAGDKLYDIHSSSSHWRRNVDPTTLTTGKNLYKISVSISIGTSASDNDEAIVVTQPQLINNLTIQEKNSIDHISAFANHFTPVGFDPVQTFLAPSIFNSNPTQNRPDLVENLTFDSNQQLYVLGSDSFITRMRLTSSNTWQLSRIPRPSVENVTQAHVRGITATTTHLFTVEESDVDGNIKRFSVTRYTTGGSDASAVLITQTIPNSQFIKDIAITPNGQHLRVLIAGQSGATYVRDTPLVLNHVLEEGFQLEARVGTSGDNGSIGRSAQAESCYFYNNDFYITYNDGSTRRFENAHINEATVPLEGNSDTHIVEYGTTKVVQGDITRPPSAVGSYAFVAERDGSYLQIARRVQIKITELTDVDDDLTDNEGRVLATGNSNNVTSLMDSELADKVFTARPVPPSETPILKGQRKNAHRILSDIGSENTYRYSFELRKINSDNSTTNLKQSSSLILVKDRIHTATETNGSDKDIYNFDKDHIGGGNNTISRDIPTTRWFDWTEALPQSDIATIGLTAGSTSGSVNGSVFSEKTNSFFHHVITSTGTAIIETKVDSLDTGAYPATNRARLIDFVVGKGNAESGGISVWNNHLMIAYTDTLAQFTVKILSLGHIDDIAMMRSTAVAKEFNFNSDGSNVSNSQTQPRGLNFYSDGRAIVSFRNFRKVFQIEYPQGLSQMTANLPDSNQISAHLVSESAGFSATTSNAPEFAVIGSQLFIADEALTNSKLRCYDIGSVDSSTVATLSYEIDLDGSANFVKTDGRYVFFGGQYAGIKMLDPVTQQTFGAPSMSTVFNFDDAVFDGQNIYFSTYTNPIKIVRMSYADFHEGAAGTSGLNQSQVDARITTLRPNEFTDADHTKLDGIEANATADQTTAEIVSGIEALTDTNRLNYNSLKNRPNLNAGAIKTIYESNANTNAFTDAEQTKLSGVETGATADQSGSEIVNAIDTELGQSLWQNAVSIANLPPTENPILKGQRENSHRIGAEDVGTQPTSRISTELNRYNAGSTTVSATLRQTHHLLLVKDRIYAANQQAGANKEFYSFHKDFVGGTNTFSQTIPNDRWLNWVSELSSEDRTLIGAITETDTAFTINDTAFSEVTNSIFMMGAGRSHLYIIEVKIDNLNTGAFPATNRVRVIDAIDDRGSGNSSAISIWKNHMVIAWRETSEQFRVKLYSLGHIDNLAMMRSTAVTKDFNFDQDGHNASSSTQPHALDFHEDGKFIVTFNGHSHIWRITYPEGISSMDTALPTADQITAQLVTEDGANSTTSSVTDDFCVIGSLLFVGDEVGAPSKVRCFDMSNVNATTQATLVYGTEDLGGSVWCVRTDGRYVFIGGSGNIEGMILLDPISRKTWKVPGLTLNSFNEFVFDGYNIYATRYVDPIEVWRFTYADFSEEVLTFAFTPRERTKLASVETNAAADQTPTEIVAAVDTQLGHNTWKQKREFLSQTAYDALSSPDADTIYYITSSA